MSVPVKGKTCNCKRYILRAFLFELHGAKFSPSEKIQSSEPGKLIINSVGKVSESDSDPHSICALDPDV